MNNLPGDSRGLEPQVRTDTQELTGTGRRFDPGIGPRTGKKEKKCAACSVIAEKQPGGYFLQQQQQQQQQNAKCKMMEKEQH